MRGNALKLRTLEQELSIWARARFAAAFPDTDLDETPLDVVPTAEERFGDYQCNAAMGLARGLKRAPRQIAEAVVAAEAPHAAIESVEIAGPGFLNITLRNAWLAERLQGLEEDPRLGVPAEGEGHTVILDYSGPNVAKQMHVGHIRSTLIGNALDRLHRFMGFRVISDNHIGDWGTQFGLLIQGYRHLLDKAAFEADPVEELERIYVESQQRSQVDPEWLEQARRELVKLQQGDEESLRAWQLFMAASRAENEKIYRRLGVSFDLERGESFYNGRLSAVVERLTRDAIAGESEGALVVNLEEEGLGVCIVRKRDGGFNYATTDLATIESRVEEFQPDQIVYVTDERQQLHFRQVFEVARRMGITVELVHVWFGPMRSPEGTFSTRKGNVIKLHRLLDESERRALEMVKEASPEMPEAQQREVARAMGIGAVKYADLSQNPQSVVTFTWEKALALDGNSAPYLQYAYARIASVQDKYRERFPDGNLAAHPIVLDEPAERRLALRLLRFADTVSRACRQNKPSVLADYLFDLAQVYSSFYQNVPFLTAEEGLRESRVRICGVTARVLRQGLELLGIETPSRI